MEAQNIQVIPDQVTENARQFNEEKLASIEIRRKARNLLLPVDDLSVRQALRLRGLPVCLFGEDAHDRRERLRSAVVKERLHNPDTDGQLTVTSEPTTKPDAPRKDTEEEDYYTEGTSALKALRKELALPSLELMRARLARERKSLAGKDDMQEERARTLVGEEALVRSIRQNQTLFSQIGDKRPLSAIAWGEGLCGSTIVATGSWSGRVSLWSGDDGKQLQTIDTHKERVSSVSIPTKHDGWLLSCGTDKLMAIHRRTESNTYETKNVACDHTARVSDVKMHPFRVGLIASVSFDGTMLLYDESKLMLRQETGHSKVYRVSFHPDGSLVGTCGLEGGLRMWDMRSGRAVMTMERAHSADVLALDFSGDGRSMASGGNDNLVRIWDLRTTRCAKTIAAHTNLISGLKFGGGVGGGDVLYTGSFDGSMKCWGCKRNWGLLAVHTSYEDKVTAVDCSPDAKVAVSACYDRTWKLWGTEDVDDDELAGQT